MGSVSHDSDSCITPGATPRGPLQRPAQQLDASSNVVNFIHGFFSLLFGKWSGRVGNGGGLVDQGGKEAGRGRVCVGRGGGGRSDKVSKSE